MQGSTARTVILVDDVQTLTCSTGTLTVTCKCGITGCPEICHRLYGMGTLITVVKEAIPILNLLNNIAARPYDFRKHEKRHRKSR